MSGSNFRSLLIRQLLRLLLDLLLPSLPPLKDQHLDQHLHSSHIQSTTTTATLELMSLTVAPPCPLKITLSALSLTLLTAHHSTVCRELGQQGEEEEEGRREECTPNHTTSFDPTGGLTLTTWGTALSRHR